MGSVDAATLSATFEFVATAVPGYHGVMVLHDKDSNGKMKKNWLGIPKERQPELAVVPQALRGDERRAAKAPHTRRDVCA